MHNDTQASHSETSGPVAAPSGRLTVKRGGHSITRQIPKPVVLVDTREQLPFDFSRFSRDITTASLLSAINLLSSVTTRLLRPHLLWSHPSITIEFNNTPQLDLNKHPPIGNH